MPFASSSSAAGGPRILLCSAWQMVNIGDIAHPPGALALLEEMFPAAEVVLWPFNALTPAAHALLRRRFPGLQIIEGKLPPDGEPLAPELGAAMDGCDFFLHSSGPATLAWKHARAFQARTGRPFGVYGVTYGLYGTPEKETLSQARFVYFRDSVSLAAAQKDGVRAPKMEWSPDVAFAIDLEDDARAAAFLRESGLEDSKYLCCLSRLRNTPFWKLPGHSQVLDEAKQARNESMKQHDHAPLIEAITLVARQTEMKVLICPEDETQMEVTHDNIVAHLPADVRERVVWRGTFWGPDEALSVYRRSAGVFGSEMHSPIMSIGNGIPAIVCRWAEQSTKGFMWRDIGLSEWLFDFDDPADPPRVAPAVLQMALDPAGAKAKAQQARERVRERFRETMAVVRAEVLAAASSASS
jgi:polysaccharide pyruvyl transferase WcaK-like protein